ncbi:hypothetical protein BaRGS_00008489 [Batillaria attramentaria]|uniref:Secreted protein n=1 Tax=Batillaria attramentaria TaxID=370345 RepID=A0ABD0LLZ7_9CAEN
MSVLWLVGLVHVQHKQQSPRSTCHSAILQTELVLRLPAQVLVCQDGTDRTSHSQPAESPLVTTLRKLSNNISGKTTTNSDTHA